MDALEGRTAVVTGAASGIGRGLAERFAGSGMNVVLADVDRGALDEAASTLRDQGASVLAMRTNVADGDSVDALAVAATEAFGNVHVLCNNAGVGGTYAMIHELTHQDWEWVLEVNLWGVIHGLRSFLPGMLAHGEEGHVVNTASMNGLRAGPFLAPYATSKHAVVAISESLYHEMLTVGGRIGVSVICPAAVDTKAAKSMRIRSAEYEKHIRQATARLHAGMPPAQVAEHVERAILEKRLYVLTHPEWLTVVEARMRAILDQTNPTPLTGSAG